MAVVNGTDAMTTWSVDEFNSTIAMLLDERGGKFKSHCQMGSHTGLTASPVDQIDGFDLDAVGSKDGATVYSEYGTDRRWVDPLDFEKNFVIAHEDTLRNINQPNSALAQRIVMAAAKEEDRQILSAAVGSAKTGTRGATTTTFPAGDIVAAGGAGLTVAKLISARELLAQNNVDLDYETPCLAVSSQGITDLLNDEKATSADYANVKALVAGEIDTFMGFKIIETQLLDESGTNIECPCWVQSGMHFGTWGPLQVEAVRNPERRNNMTLLGKYTFGVTRLEEGRVIRVDFVK